MNDLKFSEIAWAANQEIYNRIIQHPFNQELLHGTLKRDKFSYYIEQDSIYLRTPIRVKPSQPVDDLS